MGLGRVITRRRGCRRAATGGMRCNVTVSSTFSDLGLEATLVRRPAIVSGSEAPQRAEAGRSQAAIAAISGLMPTMFMTRVRL
jgi:hypothetical protein